MSLPRDPQTGTEPVQHSHHRSDETDPRTLARRM